MFRFTASYSIAIMTVCFELSRSVLKSLVPSAVPLFLPKVEIYLRTWQLSMVLILAGIKYQKLSSTKFCGATALKVCQVSIIKYD